MTGAEALTGSDGKPLWGNGYGKKRHLVAFRQDRGFWKSGIGLCSTTSNDVYLDKFSDETEPANKNDKPNAPAVLALEPCKRCTKKLARETA